MIRTDVVVVGAGFAGSVVAERVAAGNHKVLVLDKRRHIAGNAYDEDDAAGVTIHRYGPHIFHTNGQRIFEYLSNFTEWRPYEHRVLACVDGKLLPMPINRKTINGLYGKSFTEAEVQEFIESVREPRNPRTTSEDVVLDSVGRDLCEKFFRGYTRKQWGLDLSELSPGVAARIPVRTNDDDRYFTDTFQAMPAVGYTAMFSRMLRHPNITIQLNVDFREIRKDLAYRYLVYTGPIDEYFDYRFGPLPYRSLRFEHQHIVGVETHQPVGTVNYPNEHDFTRITEFKHLTGQSHGGTSIVREYPQAVGEPYYPIPQPGNEALYQKYKELARTERAITFVGRLAQYRYYNMDQVVGAALAAADDILGELAHVN
jgi:UDP-galactopyranose mutase